MAEDEASKDAETQLEAIKSAGTKKGDEVVEQLIQTVMTVRPEASEKIVVRS